MVGLHARERTANLPLSLLPCELACPAGSYGSTQGLSTSTCTGPCGLGTLLRVWHPESMVSCCGFGRVLLPCTVDLGHPRGDALQPWLFRQHHRQQPQHLQRPLPGLGWHTPCPCIVLFCCASLSRRASGA